MSNTIANRSSVGLRTIQSVAAGWTTADTLRRWADSAIPKRSDALAKVCVATQLAGVPAARRFSCETRPMHLHDEDHLTDMKDVGIRQCRFITAHILPWANHIL